MVVEVVCWQPPEQFVIQKRMVNYRINLGKYQDTNVHGQKDDHCMVYPDNLNLAGMRKRVREIERGFVIVLTDIMNVMPTVLSY